MNDNFRQFDFDSFELYKKAFDNIDFVYEITIEFPREELFREANLLNFLNYLPVKKIPEFKKLK